MVVEGGLHGGAVADDIFASDGDLQAFFHQAELEVAAGGGAQGPVEEEELEWPLKGQRRCHHCGTTKTPRWRQGPEGRGTLCNACGVRYRSGRLLPEYRPLNSPTFSPDVHSNKHHRVVEMRLCPGGLEVAAGGGGEGAAAEELDWLSNKDAMETVERKPSMVGPRTMGLCRRRRALASSPSPPRPSARAVPGQRCCRPCGTTKMVQWREAAAAAAGERKWLSRKDTFPAMEPEPSVVVPRTKGVRRRRRAQASSLSPSPPRPPTTAEPGQRRCRHCGTTETPKWREGPEGRCTLCNACGMAYRKGRLVPEYRPLSSHTFSPELHSNIYRRVN